MSEKYLASGSRLAMRMWKDEMPDQIMNRTTQDYETVGYVVKGRAELDIEGQTVLLAPGDAWVVPKGAVHRYRILEPFTAIEATAR